MATATKATQESATGIIGARRFNVTTSKQSLTIPAKVRKFVCRNAGDFEIRFNFGSDSNNDYWELAPGEAFPHPIEIMDTATINGAAIGGDSILECVFWG
jgi:hypothetical protein